MEAFPKNTPKQVLIFKKFPRRRQFSRSDNCKNKYILQGETREIVHVIQQKKGNNMSTVTFKFNEQKQRQSQPVSSRKTEKIDKNNRKTINRDIYLHAIRPLISNLSSLRIASCEVRKLQSQICSRKTTFKQTFDEFKGLQIQGIPKNYDNFMSQSKYQKNVLQKESFVRSNTSNFRVRSSTKAEPGGPSADIVELLRKPTVRKDYFVFGLSDKNDSPQTKIQNYRDFLWKINYSHGLFVVTPSDNSPNYKVCIGPGNNSVMVRGIIKRRPWWAIVERQQDANFVWTQLKIVNYHQMQSQQALLQFQNIYSQKNIKRMQQQIGQNGSPEDEYSRIFNPIDRYNWQEHCRKNRKTQQKIGQLTYVKRVGLLTRKKLNKIQNPYGLILHNHLSENYYIGNKKAMFYNLKRYCQFTGQHVFDYVPLTFHITKGVQDPKYKLFLAAFQDFDNQRKTNKTLKNIWIMKPGENTNRGNGISVCFGLDDINYRLKSKERNKDGSYRTFILQKYMQQPLLYHNRKFDIRHYMLITCFGGNIKGYWYDGGYVRTSSSGFSLSNRKDMFVHLTNDAIQKHSAGYGKYQSGNKLSYQDLEKYIAKNSRKQRKADTVSFNKDILPKMKNIALMSVKSTYHLLDKSRKLHNFQLLGLDFMIDSHYKPYLIEVNTNPCLELSCPLLSSIIPELIQQTTRICVDPFFPPPENSLNNRRLNFVSQNMLQENKFNLFFDQLMDGPQLRQLFANTQQLEIDLGKIEEDSQIFENDGDQNWQQKPKE